MKYWTDVGKSKEKILANANAILGTEKFYSVPIMKQNITFSHRNNCSYQLLCRNLQTLILSN